MTWLWWAIPLILVVLLWTLNEFLRGRLKEVISGVLSLLIFALVAIAFVISGWKAGLGTLLGAFVLINLFRPVGLAIARRLIPYPDLGFEEYGRRQLERTMKDLQSGRFFERHDQEQQEEARHKSETIFAAMTIPAIVAVLAKLNATERDLEAFYDRIEVHSLPPLARKIALHNAGLVAFFLENSAPSNSYDGTYTRTLSRDTAIRLQLWTHSNPGGGEPR